MRAFRASLTRALLALGLLSAAFCSEGSDRGHPYFPLATGNRWVYRCSIEGAPAAGRVLQIRQKVLQDGTAFYRAELRVGSDPTPLVQYFSMGDDGSLRRSLSPGPVDVETWLAADTARGTRQGGWVSAGVEPLRLPALPGAKALRVETYPIDSPDLPADTRAAWRARYYVLGVGPGGEADGLGGRCDLVSYRLAKPTARS